MHDIAKKIIEDNLCNSDVSRLMNAVLLSKCESFTTLSKMISETLSLEHCIAIIEKHILKNELLNYDSKKREEAKDVNSLTIADIDLMTGVQFEKFLHKYFTKQGYKCKQTKTSGDQGVDLIAEKDGVIIAIQVKQSSGSVGNRAVQEVVAGMKYYKANRGMVISNRSFTQSAKDLAIANNIILWDRKALKEKIKK